MRLWSIHPKYLDALGLVSLWRESLLAQKVLRGETKGFKNHPQLKRFKDHSKPEQAIANYLLKIWEEAKLRGYNFDRRKIEVLSSIKKIPVTGSQLKYEFDWLCKKLKKRNLSKYQDLFSVKKIESHPIFRVIEGEIEDWEKMKLDKVQ